MGALDFDLRLGDSLDPLTGLAGLTDKSIDVAMFDAPYSERVHASSRRGSMRPEIGAGRAAFSRATDLKFSSLREEDREAWSVQCARTVRRWSMVFSDVEGAHLWRESFERAGLEYIRTLFWVKIGGTPQFTGDRPATACEAITLVHPPGRKRWNGGGKAGVYSIPIVLDRSGREPRIHTTQKPIELMEALVRDFTDADELIADFTAGGGTTAVACKRLGRRFIGWERDPKFHAAAVKRIEAAKEQFELGGRRVKVKQPALFAAQRTQAAPSAENFIARGDAE
jgi:DNA modification methylase